MSSRILEPATIHDGELDTRIAERRLENATLVQRDDGRAKTPPPEIDRKVSRHRLEAAATEAQYDLNDRSFTARRVHAITVSARVVAAVVARGDAAAFLGVAPLRFVPPSPMPCCHRRG